MAQVLVISHDATAARAVRASFEDHVVRELEDVEDIARNPGDVRTNYVFVDTDLLAHVAESDDPKSCLGYLLDRLPGARIVVMASPEDMRNAVGFVREGASDYLTRPVSRDEVQLVRDNIERHERVRSELGYLRGRIWQTEALDSVRCNSEAMKAVLLKIRQVAPTRSTVLLTGETGTGKSYLAKVIHRISSRADRPLIGVHCGAIPDTLLESELFGHERGAFTGAERRKLGKFEIADGGTFFLDEVATISPAMQVKLLNVIQERTFQRVGGERDIEVDVRILAASNMDLGRLTEEGVFRNDLYYRLNVFPIHVPPLRARREDIPMLVGIFLDRLRALHQKDIEEMHPAVMEAFLTYDWPGNVRELENLLERAFILETSNSLSPENFPEELFTRDLTFGRMPVDIADGLATVRRRAAEDIERLYLKEQLTANHGRIDATAKAAGITPRQLHKLMSKHGLKKENFRKRRS
jgi:DNA-binding NtrC family response regulator